MIEIKDITKKYCSLVAVNHVNLTIQDGELFGLLGHLGQSVFFQSAKELRPYLVAYGKQKQQEKH